MKKPSIEVIVNSGEHEGKKGLVVGYDRDKYYEVLLNDGNKFFPKGYYLDGIENLKGHQRYLLQYTSSCPTKTLLNNRDLAQDLRFHTNKGRGYHNKFRYFSIDVHGDHGGEHYENLSFQELRRKVRYALHNKKSFDVRITSERKGRSVGEGLLEFDYQGNTLYTFETSKKNKKYLATFIRGVSKEINKHY